MQVTRRVGSVLISNSVNPCLKTLPTETSQARQPRLIVQFNGVARRIYAMLLGKLRRQEAEPPITGAFKDGGDEGYGLIGA
jgi:hypothetical protein